MCVFSGNHSGAAPNGPRWKTAIRLAGAVCAAAILAGCATMPPAGLSASDARPARTVRRPVEDVSSGFPQQARAFVTAADEGWLVDQATAAQEAARLKNLFFRPWQMKKSGLAAVDFKKAMRVYARAKVYGPHLQPLSQAERDGLISQTDGEAFPSRAGHGIVTRQTSMRMLPSAPPFYRPPWLAGEGYPFDLLQHGVVRVGTPVFVSHATPAGDWLFCETAWGAGWLETDAIALTDEAFEKSWTSLPLGVVTREGTGARSEDGAQAARLHIGTLLPYVSRQALVLPARDEHGRAQPVQAAIEEGGAQPWPLPFRADILAALADDLLGAPYDWGGAYGGRDCSLLTRELFQAVGVFLPVNSRQQLAAGTAHSLAGLSGAQKVAYLREHGRPFRTLIGLPGHVALYVGEWKGEPAILHAVWGLRTKEDDQDGRLLIGRVVITSLNPGLEWPDVRAGQTLLSRLSAMTLLPGRP